MPSTSAFAAAVPTLGDDPNVPRDVLALSSSLAAHVGCPHFTSTGARDTAYSGAGITVINGMRCSVAGRTMRYYSAAWRYEGITQEVVTLGTSSGSGAVLITGTTTLVYQNTITVTGPCVVEWEVTAVIQTAGASAGSVRLDLGSSSRSSRFHSHGMTTVLPLTHTVKTNATAAGIVTGSLIVVLDGSSAGVTVWEIPNVLREIV